jgi:hypothetical protein
MKAAGGNILDEPGEEEQHHSGVARMEDRLGEVVGANTCCCTLTAEEFQIHNCSFGEGCSQNREVDCC